MTDTCAICRQPACDDPEPVTPAHLSPAGQPGAGAGNAGPAFVDRRTHDALMLALMESTRLVTALELAQHQEDPL